MRSIHKILVANRGEIAARVMRTARTMGIATATIYSDPDRNAPFVRAADEAVYIGPPLANSSFLAIDKVVAAARITGADAVHPGYGFLAENADFAQACVDAGLTFIGPSPDTIRRMGSKIAAKRMMQAAGIPVVPGFPLGGLSDDEVESRARQLGYPLLVKASAGGGGKGMRIVLEAGGLRPALAAARREAQQAFGDDTLLIERYLESPRHIEIQILGDTRGTLIHCFERECSIQRRHQKVIEEAPSPAVTPELRARMGAAAVAAARAAAYYSAGTVELIVDSRGDFFFLEMNTRLQVEHPVTEAITGLDLVRLQILIAQDVPLALRQDDLRIDGHAIECRLYAEDPRRNFLPSTGTIACWRPSDLPGIRVDSGIETGSPITIYYDPLLAKVIAHAPTRTEAAQRLVRALDETRVHGVRTNLSLLRQILRHPEFLAGRLDTHFIGTHIHLEPDPTERLRIDRLHAVAVALWLQERSRASAPVLRGIPSGWRNSPSQLQAIDFLCDEQHPIAIGYRMQRGGEAEIRVDGVISTAAIGMCDGDGIAIAVDGLRRQFHIAVAGDHYYVHSPLGSSDLRVVPRFPPPAAVEVHGGCHAPMPGKILAIRVAIGQSVRRGELLVILEAMKMEHEVVAPHDAIVQSICVEVGQQVEAGALVAVLEEVTGDEPSGGGTPREPSA